MLARLVACCRPLKRLVPPSWAGFARAAKSNQKARRLSGWLSIDRRGWFGRWWFPFDVASASNLLRQV